MDCWGWQGYILQARLVVRQLCSNSHPNIASDHRKVEDFITTFKEWNWPPKFAIVKDNPNWILSSNGNFSVNIADDLHFECSSLPC